MGKSEYPKVKEAKKKAKQEVFVKCWPKDDQRDALMMIFAPKDKVAQKMVYELLEGCLVLPGKVLVVSESEPADFVKHPTGKITWINPEDGRNSPKIQEYLLAADMALILEEHMKDIHEIMQNGVVVVGHEKSPLLENYHPNLESGNSFTFGSFNPWDIFMALVRANETYRFPYDWQNISRNALKSV